MSWQMIEAARTGYDGLLRRQPSMCCDPVGNQLAALDVWGLHIDGADAELFTKLGFPPIGPGFHCRPGPDEI